MEVCFLFLFNIAWCLWSLPVAFMLLQTKHLLKESQNYWPVNGRVNSIASSPNKAYCFQSLFTIAFILLFPSDSCRFFFFFLGNKICFVNIEKYTESKVDPINYLFACCVYLKINKITILMKFNAQKIY